MGGCDTDMQRVQRPVNGDFQSAVQGRLDGGKVIVGE